MSTRYRLGDLLTVDELAEKLHVAVKTIRDWVYRRKVPYTKLHGHLYFSGQWAEAALDNAAREPLPAGHPGTIVRRRNTKKETEIQPGKEDAK